MNRFKEQAMKIVFMVAACASVLAVFLICLFLFANGIPAIAKIGPLKFLLGTVWKPSNDKFGIFPMIIASIYVTGGAILVGVPIALLTSVFMARYCPQKIYRPLKSGIGADGRSSFHSLWFLWSCTDGTAYSKHLRRNRYKLAGSIPSSGNHDSADNYRTDRICSSKCTGKLL